MSATFLEFVTQKLIGPPSVERGNGESEWPCPHCGHPRFHTLPHKPPFPDRFKCWSCGFRGDAHDLLQEFFPTESYGDRLDRLAQYRSDFAKASDTTLRGSGSNDAELAIDVLRCLFKEERNLGLVIDGLTPGEFRTMAAAFRIAERVKVSIELLSQTCANAKAAAEDRGTIARLLAECDRELLNPCGGLNGK